MPNGGGVFSLLILSFTTNANFSSHSLPTLAGILYFNDDIADKLAADVKFMELANLIRSDESKLLRLSLEDKKSFIKYAQENKTSELISLYAKCGIDFKKTSLQKKAIITDLNNKYELNKRSDKKEIIKSALLKAGPTFGDCLNGLMAGLMACEAFTGDAYYYCFWAVDAIYLGCLAAMD